MGKTELFRRYVLFTIALCVSSFSIALVTKGLLGTTPISSIPYVFSIFTKPTIGQYTLALNFLQVLIALVLMNQEERRNHRMEALILIPITLLFSFGIDVSMDLLSWLNPISYPAKFCTMLAGCVLLALGVMGEVKANVAMLAGEYLVRAIVGRVHKEFGIVKMWFDIANVGIAIVSSLLFCSAIEGVREGTVVAALIVGPLTHVFLPWFKIFDCWFQTDDETASATAINRADNPIIITITREYGSGGRLLAPSVAGRLGIKYYDKQFIALSAKESNLSEAFVEQNEQVEPTNFLMSLVMHDYESSVEKSLSSVDVLFVSQSKIIRRLVKEGPCVILGRCADQVLSDYPQDHIIRVFCYTHHAAAVQRCVSEYGMSIECIDKLVTNKNRYRISHYQHFTGKKWGDPKNYDLMINTANISIETATQLIADLYHSREVELQD